MLFTETLGLKHLKNHLITSADRGRIPHAQLFVGPHGSGSLPLAIAYARYILCQNTGGDNHSGPAACNKKMAKLEHPDLHFAFPVSPNKKIKSKPRVSDFLAEWRQFVLHKPYGSLFDWYQELGIANKQGQIRLRDAREITKTVALKSYEGGYKVMIIWHAELMNPRTANYLLKLIEEPPEKTLFILITDDEDRILDTIKSRCQKLDFPPLGENDIQRALMEQQHIGETDAQKIAFKADGSYAKALSISNEERSDEQFEKWFVDWVRTAFRAKGNKGSILKLLAWSEEISRANRETQKRFLRYCINLFRQALLLNYNADSLVFMEPQSGNFKLEKFAPFVHGGNITAITGELETAIYHIERNGHAQTILTDLSIKLTHLLHKK